jgi:uncharacterized membrane protein (Fun14 family)
MSQYFKMPLKTMLGGAAGFCVGIFAKQATKTIAFYLGLGIVSLSILVKL